MSDPRPSLVPVIIGFALAGFFILALGFWVAFRPKPEDSVPVVTLIEPANDTVIAGMLTLQFSTTADLRLQPTGWGAGRYHLHAMVGNRELMPAAADIRDLGNNTFTWTLPALLDTATVQLVWSLPNHRRLTDGATNPVHISPK
jgi:hypothetical protein